MPLRQHETIILFCKNRINYHPQIRIGQLRVKGGGKIGSNKGCYGFHLMPKAVNDQYYPTSIIEFSGANQADKKHPTQKPVALIEYLIKTYTLKGELILDNTAGSGTLAIAAINTDRNYICIEKDEHYFEVMRDRIKNHDPTAIKPQPKLPKKKPVNDEYIQLSLFNDCLDSL